MNFPRVLPESVLRLLSPADRLSLGKAGLTREDCIKRAEIKNERSLQRQILSYLNLKGIEVLWHRTDKKTTAAKGWPDLIFAVIGTDGHAMPCAWEIKFGKGQLSQEQVALASKLKTPPNAWRFKVITSLDEARRELTALTNC